MSHGHEDHLEEAEHASHARNDPFDRRVALSMVVIAALLAGVKLLGHRAHTETLRTQIQTDMFHTQASDQWNFFQAQKIRQHLYESQGDLVLALNKDATAQADKAREQGAKYKAKADEIQEQAKELVHKAEEKQEESEHLHHRSDRFDLGEMAVELALVLCSVAILSKRNGFWYAGIALTAIGLLATVSGLMM